MITFASTIVYPQRTIKEFIFPLRGCLYETLGGIKNETGPFLPRLYV